MATGTRWDVVVVGAGAAGILAATRAAAVGNRTLLLEKNPRPGTKILMSGGTRCNLTHDTDERGIIQAFGRPGKFLHSALAALGPKQLIGLVEAEGVATKVEETGKVFPVSDQAEDVLQALLARLRREGATLALDERLTRLEKDAGGFQLWTARGVWQARRVIITTGGQSYPGSGTTGDGYAWARELGHTIRPLHPALTPITTTADWIPGLRGITISDVEMIAREAGATGQGKTPVVLDRRRGSFLFAHFGLTGPAPLDLSRVISGHPRPETLEVVCDFLPSWKEEAWSNEVQRAAAAAGKRELGTLLAHWLPQRLGDALLRQAGLDPRQRSAELSKAGRASLVRAVKAQVIPVRGTLGYARAEVTAGGVALEEVDSRTMESRLVRGVYFAGEILDLDGPIGGYNFQAAFSTGWLAGTKAAAAE